MAYTRTYGQAQGASPWSSGVPPGLQQQANAQQPNQQAMFAQPMGPFDISSAWQSQQPAQQQWVAPMQQVQFVPNPAFMQQQPHQQQMRQMQMQNQRTMHQRSLSAPRVGASGNQKRPMNQNYNNNAGPQGQGWHNRQHNNNNTNNNNNNNNNQQRVTRQQSRMNNQKGPSNNNNNNNNSHQNKNQQQQPKQQQQLQKKAQQDAPQGQGGRKIVKVVKVKKQTVAALKAKLDNKVAPSDKTKASNDSAKADQPPKALSKTAERKQLKLQARKNAEALKQNKLPVSKTTKLANDKKANNVASDNNAAATTDQPIDQAQLKCVPAVFGFVCKLCDVFLRDKVARCEHIDSDEHMEKFKAFQEQEKAKQKEESVAAESSEANNEPQKQSETEDATVDSQAPEQAEVKPEAEQEEAEKAEMKVE